MAKVISIHEYTLKPNAEDRAFTDAIRSAHAQGLLQLPGLIGFHVVKGIKGLRKSCYAAIWVYKDRAAWERLWGPPSHPKESHEYPENWRAWEQILEPFLADEPDEIQFTSYEEVLGGLVP